MPVIKSSDLTAYMAERGIVWGPRRTLDAPTMQLVMSDVLRGIAVADSELTYTPLMLDHYEHCEEVVANLKPGQFIDVVDYGGE